MGLLQQDDEVDYLLSQIDPYKNNKMTYSEIVQLLSSHMVPSHEDPNLPADSIPILEKFSLSNDQNHLQAAASAANLDPYDQHIDLDIDQVDLHEITPVLNDRPINDITNTQHHQNTEMPETLSDHH